MPSVAEARNNLSELIDRSLAGEAVVITRHGRPVVELRPIAHTPRPASDADLDWLRANRIRPLSPPPCDAVELVRAMRDDEAE